LPGHLTNEERYIINHHMVQTILMLNHLPFPGHLRNVPEIAGGITKKWTAPVIQTLEARRHEPAGADDGDCRYFRGVDGCRPPLQESQNP
jgi:hypothetical protein